MTEEDMAKSAYAEIIKAIERCRRECRDHQWDFEIGFPDTVTVNGNTYIFTLKEDKASIQVLNVTEVP